MERNESPEEDSAKPQGQQKELLIEAELDRLASVTGGISKDGTSNPAEYNPSQDRDFNKSRAIHKKTNLTLLGTVHHISSRTLGFVG